ncbi:DNA polymerase sliding clamp [uncultured archaeon]|nr:DNA polymerase sliding clamp [uncultured archaeon]
MTEVEVEKPSETTAPPIETPPPTPEKVNITAEPSPIVQVPEESVRLAPPQPTTQKKKRILKTSMNVVAEIQGDFLYLLRESLKLLKEMVDEIPLEFSPSGLTIRAMDKSRVAMVNMNFQREQFLSYDVSNKSHFKDAPLPVTVCVNIDDLLYCIDKTVSKNATIKIDLKLLFGSQRTTDDITVYKPEKCPTCQLEVDGNNNILAYDYREKHPKSYKCRKCGWRGKATSRKKKVKTWRTDLLNESKFNVEVRDDGTTDIFEINAMDDDGETVPLPKISFQAKMKVVTKKLKEKLEKLKVKTDHVRITGSREGLIIEGGSDYNTVKSGRVEFLRGSEHLLDAEGDKQTSVYSLGYFPDFLIDKGKIAEKVSLEFTTDMPFRIKWETPDSLKHTLVEWFLAPRIESE